MVLLWNPKRSTTILGELVDRTEMDVGDARTLITQLTVGLCL